MKRNILLLFSSKYRNACKYIFIYFKEFEDATGKSKMKNVKKLILFYTVKSCWNKYFLELKIFIPQYK